MVAAEVAASVAFLVAVVEAVVMAEAATVVLKIITGDEGAVIRTVLTC